MSPQDVSCHIVSRAGHCSGPDDGNAEEDREHTADHGGAGAIVVATFPMPAGTRFDWHVHEDHQLAWAASGVLTVLTADATWVLPPTRALWIPAGLRHETASATRATMRTLYIRPGLFPVSWTEAQKPIPVAASPLLAELIGYLGGNDLDPAQRAHAESVLADLLKPVPVTTIQVRLPAGQPARQVAAALRANPADQRTLREWGRHVGASERTLARAFVSGAGVPFGHWRALLRLQAALPMLAAGEPVSRVAGRVGYDTPSAFVAAFRRETGQTPAAYFRTRAELTEPRVAGGERQGVSGQLGAAAHRARPVPHLALGAQQNGKPGRRAVLQRGAHLVRVHRVHAGVAGEHGEQHGGIGGPGHHVVVGRIREQPGELHRVRRGAEFDIPRLP
jgi:AraC-like DNA-binding protein/quercetin dioxygenase-like cupin family protein